MKKVILSVIVCCFLIAEGGLLAQRTNPLRPPAVPLVTHDPYFSVWSMDDRLTEGFSRHWTGTIQAMWGVARIDGKTFRYLGPQPTDGNFTEAGWISGSAATDEAAER